MGEQEIRNFLFHLVRDRQAFPATLDMYVNALKFLYNTTIKRPEEVKGISHPKRPKTLPVILSPEEVLRIFADIRSVKHKAITATVYAAGLKISEVCGLRIADIDSQRMRIHVRSGKGKKDRYVMLGESLLDLLRQYYQKVRPKGEYLFLPRQGWSRLDGHHPVQYSPHVILGALRQGRSNPNAPSHQKQAQYPAPSFHGSFPSPYD
jgi:integrase